MPLGLVHEDSVYEEFERKYNNKNQLEILKKLLEFIYQKREFGVTNEELACNFKKVELPAIVKHLLDSKIVIKTGIDETRYVGQKYATPWLLNSFRVTRLEREKMKPSEVSAVELTENVSQSGGEDTPSAPKKRKKGIITSEDLKSDDHSPPSW